MSVPNPPTPEQPAEPSVVPERPQRRGISRITITLWAIAVGLVVLFVPLYLIASSIRNDVARVNGQLQLVYKSLTAVPTPGPEVQKLMTAVAQIDAPAKEIRDAQATIIANHTDWQSVMSAIGNYDSNQLTLIALNQNGNQITLNGRAASDSAVTAYVRMLESSNLFSSVKLQSIKVIGTPTVSPLNTVLPPLATLTPATSTAPPNVGDEFEVDDFSPNEIFLGQPQLHNFFPIYDVDKVEFLAKSGRSYRVRTFDLAPGVDTFLSVNMGGYVYTNDDDRVGDLGSRVDLKVPYGWDTYVIVTVSNRDEFGPDQWYWIVVEEIAPTVTPTPGPTATPTDTPTPTNTFTPTPDRRDKYEPDDTNPQPIAIGETQGHNFYPNGDVDKAKFLAKAGRFYQVSTSDLAIGVDTVLNVNVGGTVFTSDDRQPGDLSSDVQFQVPPGSDLQVIVTVTDKGQYGPDKSYSLTVREIIPTSVPPTPPTATPTATSTATPDPRDRYEPDDADPKPIAIGETQGHTFYPEGDVDKVKFLAKAGRFYRVSTSGLALGVDTFLELNVAGTVYTNDDRQPGDLSSEANFQVSLSSDVQVTVTVTNRGEFGTDKGYNLTTVEFVPTTTLTPTRVITTTSGVILYPVALNGSWQASEDAALAFSHFGSMSPVASLIGAIRLLPNLAWSCSAHWLMRDVALRLAPPAIVDEQPVVSVNAQTQPVEFVIVLELKR